MIRLGFLSVACCAGLVSLSLWIGQIRPSSVISFTSRSSTGSYQLFLMDIHLDWTLQLTEPVVFCCPVWSPDGQQILFAGSQDGPTLRKRLYVINANGSDLHPLLQPSTPDTILGAWSPDGGLVAYVIMPTRNDFEIAIFDTRTGETRQITQNNVEDNMPHWSPDGQFIIFRSQSPEGVRDIYRVDPEGGEIRQLTDLPNDSAFACISPDSRQIAFISGDASHQDLFVMDADGGNLRQLTSTPDQETTPFWSPDGTQIVFRSQPIGSSTGDVYSIAAEGGDPRLLIRGTQSSIYAETFWSPDGKQLLFVSEDASGITDISVMDADGSHVRQLTHSAELDLYPAWRPGS